MLQETRNFLNCEVKNCPNLGIDFSKNGLWVCKIHIGEK